MKNFKKIVTVSSCLMIVAKSVYATTESSTAEGNYTKYIFMGVAALVIVLLLFLGYKMDSKGENDKVYKIKKQEKKSPKKEEEYEQDNESYEEDPSISVDDDFDEITEYEDEEEESLFSSSNDDNLELSHEGMSSVDNTPPSTPIEEPEETSFDEEEMGEEFDTSIIDSIEDDDSLGYTENVDPIETPTPSATTTSSIPETPNIADLSEINESDSIDMDGTMVFDNSKLLDNVLEEENNDDVEEIDIGSDTSDPLIDSLKNFKEPESTFGGFSVSDEPKDELDISEGFEKPKKYTKPKNEESEISETFNDIPADEGFLAQMERNLQKNKEERESKKNTKKATTTRKKKEE